ncbi:rhodanese-like domain-containing protein [Phycicoccus sp. CSK15P-2]|uniref:rhodanese-like domain-containing protein n=1 Tax=Phycicoccus sp. CSK15P-2 TaxID=2807627 RepID=UPI001950E341|nr:rhodanese-like domain-containing protein [Phycicoccus sp. CSK15P-2]MBM6405343.1 rhodanese-like domain-containing protein [Phycicoccus sp. CSK15P-2]
MFRHRVAAAVLAAALTAGVAGCGSGDPAVSVSEGPVAERPPASGAQLGVAEFAAALKRPGTTLLDVRTPEEFAQGHLPGAVNIDLQSPTFGAEVSQLPADGVYAVYCRSGNRSAVAVAQMTAAGYPNAYDLAGGFVDWRQAGGEVATG